VLSFVRRTFDLSSIFSVTGSPAQQFLNPPPSLLATRQGQDARLGRVAFSVTSNLGGGGRLLCQPLGLHYITSPPLLLARGPCLDEEVRQAAIPRPPEDAAAPDGKVAVEESCEEFDPKKTNSVHLCHKPLTTTLSVSFEIFPPNFFLSCHFGGT